MFDGIIPEARPQEAHDVLGTYEALTNPEMMGRQLTDVADFTAVLLHHHRTIMHGRPDKRPGQLKLDANRERGVQVLPVRRVADHLVHALQERRPGRTPTAGGAVEEVRTPARAADDPVHDLGYRTDAAGAHP